MSGQKKKYKDYLHSLSEMQEPRVPKAQIDMRGAMNYAREKGVMVEHLTREEKKRFIHYL